MEDFTFTDLMSMLEVEGLTRGQFYYMESTNAIPAASRLPDSNIRKWSIEQIPSIGKALAPLQLPAFKPFSICVYVSKGGGSHKTTTAYNFAKYLAMHGVKVLIVPLDYQQSITSSFGYRSSLIQKTGKYYKGLLEVAEGDVDVKDVVLPTNYSNLFIIPENTKLMRLEVLISSGSFKEEFVSKLIAPIKNEYDVIIYDNNPARSDLALSSIYASDVVLAPIGVDSRSIEVLPTFYETMQMNFKGKKDLQIIFIPGLVEKNSVKKDNIHTLRGMFKNMVTNNEIRKSTLIDEANSSRLSIFEYAPKSNVAEDYKKVCGEVWDRILYLSKPAPSKEIRQ